MEGFPNLIILTLPGLKLLIISAIYPAGFTQRFLTEWGISSRTHQDATMCLHLKCHQCRKSFTARRVDAKYCSHRCRQAAYEKRKMTAKAIKRTQEIPLIVAVCNHCTGTFWAKSKRAQFCSTSCRVMHHRAMRNAIPDALALVYGLPADKALDLLETQPIGRIKATLRDCGWIWSGQRRAWVQRLEFQGAQP
jgi:hypothetical protein